MERWDESESEESQRDDNGVYHRVRVYWVTPLIKLTRTKETYMAYGNETTLEHAYGDVCLIARVPPLEHRRAQKDNSLIE